MSSSKRHFTAVVGSKEHGLYISSSPSSAARKIVSKLCASSKSKKVEFCVREITQGSKKKTYGPYLGEMKKLAKPIELKGRIIRFDIKVLLKKKKTASKTAKKISKKMSGGTITDGGELDKDDFIIGDNISNYESIDNCKLIRKNDRFEEPFIFVGKKIYGTLVEGSKNKYSDQPIVYYEYVAFNEGRFSKTAKFNRLYISNLWSYNTNTYELNYKIKDVQISEIPKGALEELKKFIDKKRNRSNSLFEKNTFCNTIYKAVDDELSNRLYWPREINIINEREKQVELIKDVDIRPKYRDILIEIRKLQKLLNAPASHYGHDGWTQGFNQNAYNKRKYHEELRKLLKQKKKLIINILVLLITEQIQTYIFNLKYIHILD